VARAPYMSLFDGSRPAVFSRAMSFLQKRRYERNVESWRRGSAGFGAIGGGGKAFPSINIFRLERSLRKGTRNGQRFESIFFSNGRTRQSFGRHVVGEPEGHTWISRRGPTHCSRRRSRQARRVFRDSHAIGSNQDIVVLDVQPRERHLLLLSRHRAKAMRLVVFLD
jgi:hypothetical protein